MTTYAMANDDTVAAVTRVMNEYHPQLRDANLLVDVLQAYAVPDGNGDPVGPAIKRHGVG